VGIFLINFKLKVNQPPSHSPESFPTMMSSFSVFYCCSFLTPWVCRSQTDCCVLFHGDMRDTGECITGWPPLAFSSSREYSRSPSTLGSALSSLATEGSSPFVGSLGKGDRSSLSQHFNSNGCGQRFRPPKPQTTTLFDTFVPQNVIAAPTKHNISASTLTITRRSVYGPLLGLNGIISVD
jgi:hypothetical protein